MTREQAMEWALLKCLEFLGTSELAPEHGKYAEWLRRMINEALAGPPLTAAGAWLPGLIPWGNGNANTTMFPGARGRP